MHMIAVVLGLGAAGVAAIVAGVTVLFGMGWALIAGGTFLIAAAAVLRQGIVSNG